MSNKDILDLYNAYNEIYNQGDVDMSEASQFSRNYGDPAAAKWNAQMQAFNNRKNKGEMTPPTIPSGYRWNQRAGTIVSVTQGGASPTAKPAPTAKPTATRLTDAQFDRKYNVNGPVGDEFAGARKNYKPIAKPAAKPVVKPAAKPAPTPTAKPAPTPTATAKPAPTLPPTAPSTSPSSQLVDLQKMRIASQMRQKGANVVSTQLSSFDPFDIVMGHLLDEGFATTEEAALAIMVNMGKEWRQSILEASTETISTLQDKIAKEKLRAELEDLQQKRNQRWAANELKPGASSGVPSYARHSEQQKEYQHSDAGLTKGQSKQIMTSDRRSLEAAAGVKSGSTEKDAWYNDPNYGKKLDGKGKFFSPRTVLAKQGGKEGKLTTDPNTGKKTFTATNWSAAEKGRYSSKGGK
jgi:hypothetical protein